MRPILTVCFSMKYWETGDMYNCNYLLPFLQSLVPRAYKKGSKSKAGAIKCCKENKITAPPNEWCNIPLWISTQNVSFAGEILERSARYMRDAETGWGAHQVFRVQTTQAYGRHECPQMVTAKENNNDEAKKILKLFFAISTFFAIFATALPPLPKRIFVTYSGDLNSDRLKCGTTGKLDFLKIKFQIVESWKGLALDIAIAMVPTHLKTRCLCPDFKCFGRNDGHFLRFKISDRSFRV